MPNYPQLTRWRGRRLVLRAVLAAGAVLLLVGFGWLWWQGVPALYRSTSGISPADRLKATTDTRTALLAGLAAVVALGTFWLNTRAQRFTAQTLQVSERTFRLAERGHLTDRYTKAIAQLGDDTLDVRLGGIYALEQLATDSEQARDQDTIVEVLSAFVRVHSDPVYQYTAAVPAADQPPVEQRRKAAEYVAELDRLPVDVQAALTVLGRLPARPSMRRPDLSTAYLRKAYLAGANLAEARLGGANLAEAYLGGTNLTKAHLGGTNLTKAHLGGTSLAGTDLVETSLAGTRLVEANLTEAHLVRANLTKAHLVGTNLTKAHLVGASLAEAHLGEASLAGTDLGGASLAGTDLGEAKGLTQQQVSRAIGSETTTLPAGLERPESWATESR